MRVTSSCLRGVPSGLELSHSRRPGNPTTSRTSSASSRTVRSSPVPMLTGDGSSYSSSKAGYFPTLAASFGNNWNGNRSNDYQFFQGRSLSLSLNWQLFNGFTREQNIATAAVGVVAYLALMKTRKLATP